jgi:hypothetical protein
MSRKVEQEKQKQTKRPNAWTVYRPPPRRRTLDRGFRGPRYSGLTGRARFDFLPRHPRDKNAGRSERADLIL